MHEHQLWRGQFPAFNSFSARLSSIPLSQQASFLSAAHSSMPLRCNNTIINDKDDDDDEDEDEWQQIARAEQQCVCADEI
jgi:hypothetical protein